MNIVNGQAIATLLRADLKAQIATLSRQLRLAIIACDPNFETQKYLDLKQRIAADLGIVISTTILPSGASTEDMLASIDAIKESVDGIIVQLPLPVQIDTDHILRSIPIEQDVDVFKYLGEQNGILPPVVGAIDEISLQYQISWQDKQVVIFGAGRLVGGPMSTYAKGKGSKVQVLDANSSPAVVIEATKDADIIVLGVGKANILTKEMVKPGVVVFDAGASEDGGVLVGDAASDVAEVASLFTPVPGGIGPITIAILFRNLLALRLRQ